MRMLPTSTHFSLINIFFSIMIMWTNLRPSLVKTHVMKPKKKKICNWIEKKTLDSHISFVNIRRWKLLINGLLSYEIWFNFSYLSAKFMCLTNHTLIGFFSCTGSSTLLENATSMFFLVQRHFNVNIHYIMKC